MRASAAVAIACDPLAHRLGRVEGVDRGLQAVDELGHAAREVDGEALDVVDRQHALEQPVALLGHRHADEHAVEARLPGPGGQVLRACRGAVRGVEAPADAAVGDPVADAREVLVLEAEAPAHGLAVGEVEHVRGGQAAAGEVEQLGDDAEHRVGLAQRAVGEADAQVGRAQLVGERLELVVVDDLAGAEGGLDQRRERLDVRAHHDHVARLQRVVLLQQVEDRVAQDLDLARAAVAGVDLDAAVGGVERRAGVGGARAAGRRAGSGRRARRPGCG